MQVQITQKVRDGLRASGFATTASRARWIGCARGQVIDAFDEIEAAGIKLMRIRGVGGAAQFLGKRMRKAA